MFEIKSQVKCFNGTLTRFSHSSAITGTTMTATVYLPNTTEKCPTLLYLSGLTCTDENVCTKGGPLFKQLSALQMAFIAPDTSPRGANIQGEADSWDFGVGAGFYVNATEAPWSTNYRMYSYILEELLPLVAEKFPLLDSNRMGITGHSMGGHGALTLGLKNPSKFKSLSAFAPICHPSACPWGIKAFTGYLGKDTNAWKAYDATELITTQSPPVFTEILVDVGTKDPFLTAGQLLPEDFKDACATTGQKLTLRYQEDYDHGYYFISTFIEDHINFHHALLSAL